MTSSAVESLPAGYGENKPAQIFKTHEIARPLPPRARPRQQWPRFCSRSTACFTLDAARGYLRSTSPSEAQAASFAQSRERLAKPQASASGRARGRFVFRRNDKNNSAASRYCCCWNRLSPRLGWLTDRRHRRGNSRMAAARPVLETPQQPARRRAAVATGQPAADTEGAAAYSGPLAAGPASRAGAAGSCSLAARCLCLQTLNLLLELLVAVLQLLDIAGELADRRFQATDTRHKVGIGHLSAGGPGAKRAGEKRHGHANEADHRQRHVR